jgi:hypothetical protein
VTPNRNILGILLATKSHTYKEVGAAHGISKQRVGQIARRWKEYLPVRPLPARTALENGRDKGRTKTKENRIQVISFRLTATEIQLLHRRYPEMKSAARAARSIVTRFLSV